MNIRENILKNNEKAMFALRELYGMYGYSRFKMSKFEEYDLYVGNKSFLISDNVITFTENGRLMALKPDVTLSIVKNSKVTPGYVEKVYYDENVYRVSGGSYKEIMQVGLECIGAIDRYVLSEALMLAVRSLELISSDYVLGISHLGILSRVLDLMGVSEQAQGELITAVGKKNLHGIDAICQREGVDGSLLKALVASYGSPEKVFGCLAEYKNDTTISAAMEELTEILAPVEVAVKAGKVILDFSVVGDMGYYNGLVMKGFINGIPQSILSGGQYDKLLSKMGKKAGAVGFAVYPDMLDSLPMPKKAYDVDTVILYDEKVSPLTLHNTVRLFTEGGKSVMAQKEIPEKLTYRQLLKLTESGVQILENNA